MIPLLPIALGLSKHAGNIADSLYWITDTDADPMTQYGWNTWYGSGFGDRNYGFDGPTPVQQYPYGPGNYQFGGDVGVPYQPPGGPGSPQTPIHIPGGPPASVFNGTQPPALMQPKSPTQSPLGASAGNYFDMSPQYLDYSAWQPGVPYSPAMAVAQLMGGNSHG